MKDMYTNYLHLKKALLEDILSDPLLTESTYIVLAQIIPYQRFVNWFMLNIAKTLPISRNIACQFCLCYQHSALCQVSIRKGNPSQGQLH